MNEELGHARAASILTHDEDSRAAKGEQAVEFRQAELDACIESKGPVAIGHALLSGASSGSAPRTRI